MTADPKRSFAAAVVGRLVAEGHEAYWAGGCVRDILLGLEPSDYDVATSARPEQVMAIFRRTCAVGASFGVVRVLGQGVEGDVEVATFRSDGDYHDGRHPASVTFSTAEFDASRRDFTINGMFLDPSDNRVIDHVGGRADLVARVLRAIGDPRARFAEDKLRLLRAVRFAARFGLAIDPATRAAIVAMAPEVTTVSAERIAQELRKMLAGPARVAAIDLAMETKLIAAILPEIAPNPRLLANLPGAPSFPLAFAALILDGASPALAGRLARNLKLSNAERERIVWLVAQRGALRDAPRLRESSLKRLLASEGIGELIALHRAQALATDGDAAHVDFCERYLRDQPDGPIDPPPLLNGHDLARHGLRPGPAFATLLEVVRDAQLERLIHSKADALDYVDRLGRANPEHSPTDS